MVHLPIVTRLEVANYRLFPGEPASDGIRWSFQQGLTLVAGINGLGKTTLVTMILRSITGPYDLTSDGMPPSLDVVLPAKPVSLKRKGKTFFADRVSDGAAAAEVSLSVTIGDTDITISRRLANLSLISLRVNGSLTDLPLAAARREELVQATIAQLMGLSSFVDVLLVLHHLVMFLENRPGALWDANAQRQLLRALCLEKDDAFQIVRLERELQSADSQARNVHARMEATRHELQETERQGSGADTLLAQLDTEQTILDADLDEASQLEELLSQLDRERRSVRLALERAKLERENAAGAVERIKYTVLLRYFPSMDDTTRLVLSRIMNDGRCLVCNSEAEEKRLALEDAVSRGCCPICGTAAVEYENIVPAHEFEEASLSQARERAERARHEEETKHGELYELVNEYNSKLERLIVVRQSIQDTEQNHRRLRTRLASVERIGEYERALSTLEAQYQHWQAIRGQLFQSLQALLREKRGVIVAKSALLTDRFGRLARMLLVEDVRLAQIDSEPRYLQAPGHRSDRIQVSAYVAEMKAVDRPGFVRRSESSDVSESQREIIDLAFRLALIEVFCGVSTLVVETPEASLDAVSMERVGRTLVGFASEGENRLLVTTNLTNVGIITTLFGGIVARDDLDERLGRVLNLMLLAAPNLALVQDQERYDELLRSAVAGVGQ